MKKTTISLDDRELEISTVPIIKYSELIRALETLPKRLSDLGGKDGGEIIGMLPLLISDALPDFIHIISIATSLKKEEVEQMGLATVVKITEGILEVNDFEFLFDRAKKAYARYQASKQQ